VTNRLEEAFKRCGIDPAHEDAVAESVGYSVGPGTELVGLTGEIRRESCLTLVGTDLMPQAGDVPGYLAMRAVEILGYGVADDLDHDGKTVLTGSVHDASPTSALRRLEAHDHAMILWLC
jgi:hypothetical protein